MKVIAFIALAAAMHVSSALGCSIEALQKVAGEHLERFPSGPKREFADTEPDRESEGRASWQLFENEKGTPHSIVIEMKHGLGQDKIRISFLNRRSYVITVNNINYADLVLEKKERTGKFLIGDARHYFFCDDELRLPADTADRRTTTNMALYWKELIFEKNDDLKPDLQRIPE